jgi:hypothetical protein
MGATWGSSSQVLPGGHASWEFVGFGHIMEPSEQLESW